jgi:hypothetical protein
MFIRGGGSRTPALGLLQHPRERFQPIGLGRPLVPTKAADAGKAHGDARFMPRRALQSFESDLEYQALVGLVHDLAYGPKPPRSVAAHEPVDPSSSSVKPK